MRMLVKFFKRGGVADNKYSTGGRAVKEYLLNERVENGTAKLLKGDPDQVTEIINSLGYSKIFTSGCLSFDADESKRVDDNLKQKLMSDFERALFGDFDKSRVSRYWVEHSDKDRLELNFVFANVDLLTGKNLPVYYHANDQYRINDFKDLANLTYDLSDPNAPERKQITIIDNNQSQSRKDIKTDIHNLLTQKFIMGDINCRDDVVATLVECGFEITRVAPKSLSIKHPNDDKPQPIRLKGAFYEQQFQSSDYIATPTAENKPSKTDRAERINDLSNKIESAISRRTQSLNDRLRPNPYKSNRRKQRKDNDRVIEIRHDTANDSRIIHQAKRPDIAIIPEFFEPNSIPSADHYTEPKPKNGIGTINGQSVNQRLGTVESRHDSTAHHQQTVTTGNMDSLNNSSRNRGSQPINTNHHQWQNIALAISLPSDYRFGRGGLGGYGCYQESKQRERINEYKSDYTISFSNVRESISRYIETAKQSYFDVATMAKSACEHLQSGIRERHSQIDRQLEQYRPIRQRHSKAVIRESAETNQRLGDIGEQFNKASERLEQQREQFGDISDSFNYIIQSADRRTNQFESANLEIGDCLKLIEKKKINGVDNDKAIEPLPTPKAEPPKQTYKPPRLR